MVIQKFVADIEKTELPGVVVVPNAVLSELDWCVDSSWQARLTIAGGLKGGLPVGRRTRRRIYRGPPVLRLGGS